MNNTFAESIQRIATWLWGPQMLILLCIAGIYFTVHLKGIQFTKFFEVAKLTFTKRTGSGEGNITPLQSLFGALGGIIGNGTLAGIPTAIYLGGPGALFWMWIASFIAMIIVYSETLLALMSREISSDGTYSGGPMFYIQKVLKLKWLAFIYALALTFKALFGTTTMQSNSVSLATYSAFDFSWVPEWMPPLLPVCALLAILTLIITIGGIWSIARALEKITPFMILMFMVMGSIIIVFNIDLLLTTIALVFEKAFTPASAAGGFAGASIMYALRYGVARGFYSNEAGSGSQPIMYSAAKVDNIHEQSLVGMFGVFIDTVVSTLVALTILITGVWTIGTTSSALTTSAFQTLYGNYGGYIVFLSSFLFGLSSLLAWCFYGEQCFSFMFGARTKKYFRIGFCIMISIGFIKVETILSVGDIFNAILITVNVISILFLIHKVSRVMK